MFRNLARLDAFRRIPAVPAPAPSNDNHPGRHLAAATPRRLVCRWQANAATGRIECRWDLESEEPSQSIGLPEASARWRAAA